VQNPFSANGVAQIGLGTLGNVVGGKLGDGFTSAPTALPFAGTKPVGSLYKTFAEAVGNVPQQTVQALSEKKSP
jgi:hypothetical protein